MRVLIVHPHLTFLGGAELVVVKLSEGLAKAGIKNSILTLSLSEQISTNYPCLNFIVPNKQYPCKSKSVSLFNATRVINETILLSRLIRRFGRSYDVINVHNFPATWAYALSGLKKPSVWYCNEIPNVFWHNPHPSFALKIVYYGGSILDKWIIARWFNVICSADSINAERVIKTYKKTSKIVPYGIESDFFEHSGKDDSDLLEKYNLQGKFILSQIGLITPQKNQMASVKAIGELVREMPEIKLVLAGRVIGSYIEELKKYIAEEGLAEYVVFTGHLSHEEIRSLYKISNVALFPVKVQGGWLSPFEAICCERPIVVSSTMGASVLIKEHQLGVATDNLAEAIRKIRQNYSFHKERAKQAKQWVKENLSWDAYTEKMINVFNTLLS